MTFMAWLDGIPDLIALAFLLCGLLCLSLGDYRPRVRR